MFKIFSFGGGIVLQNYANSRSLSTVKSFLLRCLLSFFSATRSRLWIKMVEPFEEEEEEGPTFTRRPIQTNNRSQWVLFQSNCSIHFPERVNLTNLSSLSSKFTFIIYEVYMCIYVYSYYIYLIYVIMNIFFNSWLIIYF